MDKILKKKNLIHITNEEKLSGEKKVAPFSLKWASEDRADE